MNPAGTGRVVSDDVVRAHLYDLPMTGERPRRDGPHTGEYQPVRQAVDTTSRL